MAAREIKTTIALDGEQQFKKALADATREMRVMDSELKAVTEAYKANGDGAEYFAQKQQNLKGQIAQQENIIRALEQAVEDAGRTYGESSAQVDGWAIKLNNARAKMSRLEQQLNETDREVEELGRDSVKAGRQIEDGIGDGAENAEKDVKSLIKTMQDDFSAIRTNTTITALGSLWDFASGAFSSVDGFVSGTVELRRQLSFLEQNAQTSGLDFSVLIEQLKEVTAVTGDTSSSVEGLSNLMATGMDEQQLAKAVDLLAGAVISFPDTLKFESLADSLQETLATGEATGQYAELLNRMGVSTEEFNAALKNSGTAAGDLDIALGYLAAGGMQNVYDQWSENNAAMVEAGQTQQDLELELAAFGGKLEEYIVTPVKGLLVDALKWVNDTTDDEINRQETKLRLEQKVASGEISQETADAVNDWVKRGINSKRLMQFGSALEEVGELVGITEGSKSGIFDYLAAYRDSEYLQEYYKQPKEMPSWMRRFLDVADYSVGNIKTFAEGILDADETIAVAKAKQSGEEAGEAYLNGMETVLDTSAWSEMEEDASVQLIQPVEGAFAGWAQTIKAAQKELEAEERGFAEAGEDAGNAFAEAFESRAQELIGRTSILGTSAGMNFGAGLRSTVSYVNSAAAAVAAAASAGLSTARAGLRDIILQVDGRDLARTTAEYYGEALSVAD